MMTFDGLLMPAVLALPMNRHSFYRVPDDAAVLFRVEGGGEYLRMWVYRIERYTACGAWVLLCGWLPSDDPKRLKFVNLRATKQWASATETEAMNCFRCRKARQVQILTTQLSRAKQELAAANLACEAKP